VSYAFVLLIVDLSWFWVVSTARLERHLKICLRLHTRDHAVICLSNKSPVEQICRILKTSSILAYVLVATLAACARLTALGGILAKPSSISDRCLPARSDLSAGQPQQSRLKVCNWLPTQPHEVKTSKTDPEQATDGGRLTSSHSAPTMMGDPRFPCSRTS
jgi:hypothetical protein